MTDESETSPTTAINANDGEAVIDTMTTEPLVEMVAVSREWAQDRVDQFRDHERHSLQTWAWRMYRDLCEIVQFDPLDSGRTVTPPSLSENGSHAQGSQR